jgi:hypothetical protein
VAAAGSVYLRHTLHEGVDAVPRDALRVLQEELGSVPPDELAALSDGQLQALAAAVRTAREQQGAAINDATERALGYVPWPLREPARRILG